MYKVRSENGHGFLRPGLTTDVGNGSFGLKLGLDLGIRAAHPHQTFQGVPPWEISFRILLKQFDYSLLFSIK